MIDQRCDFCNQLFVDGQIVKATVVAHYKTLKSKRVYAIEKPFDCLAVKHYDCDIPAMKMDEYNAS